MVDTHIIFILVVNKSLNKQNKNMSNIKEKLNIKYVPTNLLRPSEYNPRLWNKEAINQLKQSIKKYGFVDPLLVNTSPNRKNILIGGHFRLSIAKELGIKEVPVVYLNIPDIEKEKELNIRLNKNIGEFSSFSFSISGMFR